ncbi:MAG: Hpt domain-containing protein [Candidatus Acidiferrum sp.]
MKKEKEIPSEPAWNQAELLERADNDQELIRELLTIFKENFPRSIQSLKSAVAGGNMKNTASLSHGLKGMLSNLGAGRAGAAAARLEVLAAGGEKTSLDDVQDALKGLEREGACLMAELDAYMTEVRR